MHIVIDKIRLHAPEHHAAFVQWVQEVDYATCPSLPSVQQFQVIRAEPGGDFDYFEIVHVTSLAAFQADMQTPAFQGLVERFTAMAQVVESFSGPLLPPGYARHA